MPLNYSNGSSKPGVNSLYYSNGTTKSPLASLYYSNGTSKLPVWTGSIPFSDNYRLIASTGATSNNGKIVMWDPELESISQEFGPGDWKGFYWKDYAGNLYGQSRNMGEDRRNYLETFMWDYNNQTFIRNSGQIDYIDSGFWILNPVNQNFYKIAYNSSTEQITSTRYIPNSLDPTVSRTYTAKTPIASYPGINFFAGPQRNLYNPACTISQGIISDDILVWIDGFNGFIYLIYLSNPSSDILGNVLDSDYKVNNYIFQGIGGGYPFNQEVVIAQSQASSYTIFTYYSTMLNKEAVELKSLNGYVIVSDVGYTKDFRYYMFVVRNQSNQYYCAYFDTALRVWSNVNPIVGTNVIPTASTPSKTVNYTLQFLNISGSYQNYTGDVVWTKYENSTKVLSKTFSSLRFTSNGLGFYCNTPYWKGPRY